MLIRDTCDVCDELVAQSNRPRRAGDSSIFTAGSMASLCCNWLARNLLLSDGRLRPVRKPRRPPPSKVGTVGAQPSSLRLAKPLPSIRNPCRCSMRRATASAHRLPLEKLVPPKIRELIADLQSAGFVDRGGRGSHRDYVHPRLRKPVTISGNPGDDAKPYQVSAVRLAIQESRR